MAASKGFKETSFRDLSSPTTRVESGWLDKMTSADFGIKSRLSAKFSVIGASPRLATTRILPSGQMRWNVMEAFRRGWRESLTCHGLHVLVQMRKHGLWRELLRRPQTEVPLDHAWAWWGCGRYWRYSAHLYHCSWPVIIDYPER